MEPVLDLSFIIPAYNEAANIENVIRSINEFVPGDCTYETIVVDHGSSDATVELAQNAGATVLVNPQGTIAGLRNHGVSNSQGKVLVFLDADILLTKDWSEHIGEVETALAGGERKITGSWYSIPDEPTWIEYFWFKPLERGDNTHINSGHLIISRQCFDEIGGFDEKLETGEDYEISVRAIACGLKMIDDVRLRVIHEGYPKTLAEFIKREFWHGKGDALSLALIMQSKVAMVSMLFLLLHAVLFVNLFTGCAPVSAAMLVGISGIVFATSYLKYRDQPLLTVLVNSFIYYVYFWARGLSVLSLPGIRRMRKRTR